MSPEEHAQVMDDLALKLTLAWKSGFYLGVVLGSVATLLPMLFRYL